MLETLPIRIQNKISVQPDGCWLWIGCKNNGYGWTNLKSKYLRAHQLTYQILIGPVPKEKELHHICRVKHCCNPAHLEVHTRKTHLGKHIGQRPKSYCKNGHPLSGNNLKIVVNIYHPHGQRHCRICMREAMKRYHKKNSSGRPPGRPRKS